MLLKKTDLQLSDLRKVLQDTDTIVYGDFFNSALLRIALIHFYCCIIICLYFYLSGEAKKPIRLSGDITAKRLLINVIVPMITGGIFLLALINNKTFGFVAPGCLIFYGLAVLNASKYTLPEIRYLGYGEILLGLINLFFIGYGLYFWAAGFGLLHIIYGVFMWWKYERN